MKPCIPSGVLLACLPALLSAQAPTGLDPSSTIVYAADRDDGAVSAEEWSAFRTELSLLADREGADGQLDRRLVLASVFRAPWDKDSDGSLTASDLRAIFEQLDQDTSGELSLRELNFEVGSTTEYFARRILFDFADVDASSLASSAEWEMLNGGAEEELSLEQVWVWLDAAITAPPPSNKNAITPGVYLLTLDAALDADFSGTVTLADLDQLFASIDGDQNGELTTEELRAGPRAAAASPSAMSTANLKGPLMPWQRSLEDALAIANQTGKPLLICVNIDGESASETLARFQYRNPEFVALVEGFVPVLFSPDSHNPRERDDRGRRLPDPKFGRVITSEHTENEAELYERYFGGTRVAPRHIGVTAAGEILFDIKLVNDLSIIDRALESHGVFEENAGLRAADATEGELLNSPDAAYRDSLEEAFATGDTRTRVRLASLALSSARQTQHPELLRMAYRDDDSVVREQAVWTTIQHAKRVPTELFLFALGAAHGELDQTNALLGAIEQVARTTADETRKARTERLVRVFSALASPSAVLDPERWKLALRFAPASVELAPAEAQIAEVSGRLSQLEKLLKHTPEDRELNLLFADTLIRLARIQMLSGGNPTYLFEDARLAAARTTSASAPNGRGLGYLAWANYQLLDASAVEYAATALPLLRSEAHAPLTSHVLQVFAQGRLSAFYSALAEDRDWPGEWIADIRDVHEVLMLHPAVTEAQVIGYVGFLETIEAFQLQADVLQRGLTLFPASTELHKNFRAQILRDGGARAMAEAYRALSVPENQVASFEWYFGLAELVAAERHVQNQAMEEAQLAYLNSVNHFRESFREREDFRRSAVHYIALSLAGSARLHMDEQNLEVALSAILEGLLISPSSASIEDGLGNTPAGTASRLHRVLVREGRTSEASALREVLDARPR